MLWHSDAKRANRRRPALPPPPRDRPAKKSHILNCLHTRVKVALLTEAVVAHTPEYNKAMALMNDVAGVPARTIPQMRQVGPLALIRNGLGVGSESAKLIEACQHAGGRITIGGVDIDQALLTGLRLALTRSQTACRLAVMEPQLALVTFV